MLRTPCHWAGGKRQLIPQILDHLPARIANYYEPFLGGGSVLLAVLASGRVEGRVRVGDANPNLIATYVAIRDDVEALVEALNALVPGATTAEVYYERRAEYNARPTPALFLYLNAACYRGLYRENAKGGFNVPFGHYKTFAVHAENLRGLSTLFRAHNVEFLAGPWQATVQGASVGDFVYCDPPYTPLNAGSFTTYVAGGFGAADHKELVDWAQRSAANVLYSNHDTPAVIEGLGTGWRVDRVSARRAINSKKPGSRTDEILAANYFS